MVLINYDDMKTLPYFLRYGTRPNELCFVKCHGEIRCVLHIDADEHYIETIPYDLWDSKVTKHDYSEIVVLETSKSGEVKSIRNLMVHNIYIIR